MNNNDFSITLIISTYNWPEALKIILLSVINQTYLPIEVIVADDGSRDDTRELIEEMQKSFPCKLIHVWQEDNGFRVSEIRNKAIVKAAGDYIVQIDGDIILEKHFIEDHYLFAQKSFFTQGSRVKLSPKSSSEILRDGKVDIPFSWSSFFQPNRLRLRFLQNYFRFIYKVNHPYLVRGCNIAFWKEDLLRVNGYNEDIIGWGYEDNELGARLIFAGIKRQFLKIGAVGYHLDHPINSRDKVNQNHKTFLETINSEGTYCQNGLDKY